MLLRDYLNEFELDWAQAPVRSGLISGKEFKGTKVLLVGEQQELLQAVAWSFLAWNDKEKAGIRVESAFWDGEALRAGNVFGDGVRVDQTPDNWKRVNTESAQNPAEAEKLQNLTETGFAASFYPEEADYVILTGFCGMEVPEDSSELIACLKNFRGLVKKLAEMKCRRVILLSDGRVYGKLGHEFAASEYEAGYTDPALEAYEEQYVLQAMEGMLVSGGKESGFAYNILRTGLIYGPCIPMMEHPAAVFAQRTAASKEIQMTLTPERSSYICIHDVLTAIQFVLTKCPQNKIFNVSGLESNASAGELAMMLYRNFPEQCKMVMSSVAVCQEHRERGVSGNRIDYEWKATDRRSDCQKDLSEGQISSAQNGQARILNPENKMDDSIRRQSAERIEDWNGADTLPKRCRHLMETGILLNTQLLCHYGFVPSVSLEDGLIILVKSLQNTGEVFIFDNTYLGKLETVHEILLGYLLEIDRICKKHNIKYFLAGGTLLGAIRHHGFIPWDDDADVMMLREDYDKFQEVVRQELPDNIFLQLPTTEKGNYNPFTKLRINNTMFATEFTGHFMDMHNGIFFDVLSHDKTGNHKWSQKLHLMITMLSRSVVFNKWGNTNIKSGGSHPLICKFVDKAKYLVPMPFAVWAQNRALEFFKNRKSDYLYDGMGRNLKRGSFPAKWLEEAVYVDFEGYQFPVPKEYDKYLTYLYGDYMQMIPVSQRRTSHSIVLTDLGEYAGYKIKK